jgi:hypothetical protein
MFVKSPGQEKDQDVPLVVVLLDSSPFYLFIYLLAVLGFEFRTSCLLGRWSTVLAALVVIPYTRFWTALAVRGDHFSWEALPPPIIGQT